MAPAPLVPSRAPALGASLLARPRDVPVLGLPPAVSQRRHAARRTRGGGASRQHSRGARRAAALDGESEFGRAGASQEVWEAYATEARDNWRALVAAPAFDVVDAALQLAAEDDAVRTRTTVPLPVDRYLGRIDKLVAEVEVQLGKQGAPAGNEDRVQLAYDYVFAESGYRYKLPVADELTSPYRTYVHNVLAQRQGVPSSLACILYGVLSRLQAKGRIEHFDVALPPRNSIADLPSVAAEVPPGWQVATPARLIGDMLAVLKRAYWPWSWHPNDKSGFLPAAEALVAARGRVDSVGSVVGVLQGFGRPFGDLRCSRMTCERLAELEGGHEWRDVGVIYAHEGEWVKAYECCRAYGKSTSFVELCALASNGDASSGREVEAYRQMVVKCEREIAELSLQL